MEKINAAVLPTATKNKLDKLPIQWDYSTFTKVQGISFLKGVFFYRAVEFTYSPGKFNRKGKLILTVDGELVSTGNNYDEFVQVSKFALAGYASNLK